MSTPPSTSKHFTKGKNEAYDMLKLEMLLEFFGPVNEQNTLDLQNDIIFILDPSVRAGPSESP